MFDQTKHGRGFRQFLPRGLEKVNQEWSPICTGPNLLNLLRCGADCSAKGQAVTPSETLDW